MENRYERRGWEGSAQGQTVSVASRNARAALHHQSLNWRRQKAFPQARVCRRRQRRLLLLILCGLAIFLDELRPKFLEKSYQIRSGVGKMVRIHHYRRPKPQNHLM